MAAQRVQEMMRLMAQHIAAIAGSISDEEVERFIGEILHARRIYIMGAGRSGLVAKAFAMRLMHLGLASYVVGETITPAMKPGDLVVVFSGSGMTKTVADIAETAKEIGGRVALITSNKDSRIGRVADTLVIIEHRRDEVRDEGQSSRSARSWGSTSRSHRWAPSSRPRPWSLPTPLSPG